MGGDSLPEWWPKFEQTIGATVDSAVKRVLDVLTQKVDMIGSATKALETCVTDLSGRLERAEAHNARLTKEVLLLKSKVGSVEKRAIDIEGQGRRSNLIFSGIPEPAGEPESWDQTEDAVMSKIKEHLGLDRMKVERAHRLGPAYDYRGNRRMHRKIIVKFSFYKDRESVYAARKGFKGSDIFVDDDHPMEVRQRQFELRKAIKDAGVKRDEDKVFIPFPFYEAKVGQKRYTLKEGKLHEVQAKGNRQRDQSPKRVPVPSRPSGFAAPTPMGTPKRSRDRNNDEEEAERAKQARIIQLDGTADNFSLGSSEDFPPLH